MDELKPCPFCGSRPHYGLQKVRYCSLHGEPLQDFSVWCVNRCARKTAGDRNRAAVLWNTRAADKEALALLREARTSLEDAAQNFNVDGAVSGDDQAFVVLRIDAFLAKETANG